MLNDNGLIFLKPPVAPNIQECKILLLKIVEQAVRDYINIDLSTATPKFIEIQEEAKDFLFDDTYAIQWGDIELTLEKITAILDIDVLWFRKKILTKTKKERKNGRKNRSRIPSR